MKNTNLSQQLLNINALSLKVSDPFTWTSGIKSPIYCDNRLIISYPKLRKEIIKQFKNYIEENNLEVDAIVGTATAGIPYAAWLADALNLPMAYVRPQAKKHGKTNYLEGHLKDNLNVIVVEDLISTGKSSLHSARVLRDLGHNVIKVLAIFSYEMDLAKENFTNHNLTYHSLTNIEYLKELALAENYINNKEFELIKVWQNNPENYADQL